MDIKILTIPGYGGSGREHWQTCWEQEFGNIRRVEQRDWDKPELDLWVEILESYLVDDQKYILVGHSLACALVAHWAAKYDSRGVIGALLVSPSDVDSADFTPEEVRCFSPMPLEPLPFPSILVASENDPYVSIERAEYFAKQWQSDFRNIGAHGHVNAGSNLGSWEDGKTLLEEIYNLELPTSIQDHYVHS